MEANVEPLLTISINKVSKSIALFFFFFFHPPHSDKWPGLSGIGGWFRCINEICQLVYVPILWLLPWFSDFAELLHMQQKGCRDWAFWLVIFYALGIESYTSASESGVRSPWSKSSCAWRSSWQPHSTNLAPQQPWLDHAPPSGKNYTSHGLATMRDNMANAGLSKP